MFLECLIKKGASVCTFSLNPKYLELEIFKEDKDFQKLWSEAKILRMPKQRNIEIAEKAMVDHQDALIKQK